MRARAPDHVPRPLVRLKGCFLLSRRVSRRRSLALRSARLAPELGFERYAGLLASKRSHSATAAATDHHELLQVR